MADSVSFAGWRRSGLHGLATGVEGGRVRGAVTATLSDSDRTVTEQLPFLLPGPADVSSLTARAVRRVVPTSGATDAEHGKLAHIEFADPELPWRYTPLRNPTGAALRPWLVLVVGTETEITITGRQATLTPAVCAAHPLAKSAAWAHLQEADGGTVARLLCPRRLTAGTIYRAVLVPAYRDGADAWAPGQTATVPVLHEWRFATAAGGDFVTLAKRLRARPATPQTGTAPVSYPRLPFVPALTMRGALAPLGSTDPEPPPGIVADLTALAGPQTDAIGRSVVGLPAYGDAWISNPSDTTWGAALNTDPRHRGAAGLGGWLATELQDDLADEAARQYGALTIAEQRLGHLEFGLAAAGALWRRRLPADPARRIWLFGPALRRVVTSAGTAAELLTADDRPLSGALLSAAARRVLRAGPARTALAKAGAFDPAQLLPAVNACPGAGDRDSIGIALPKDFDDTVLKVINAGKADTKALRTALQRIKPDEYGEDAATVKKLLAVLLKAADDPKSASWTAATVFIGLLAEYKRGAWPDWRRRLQDLERQIAADLDTVIKDLLPTMVADPPQLPPCRVLDIKVIAADLTRAFDPTGATGAARNRVLATVDGLVGADPLAPPELCPAIPRPAWQFLAGRAPHWLLPGVGDVPPDTVVAVQTNPQFVDAFLVGLNGGLVAELRWRNLPVSTGCTPLRTFWQRLGADGPLADIVGVAGWADGSRLGAAAHRPGDSDGPDLVLVFRGELFRRFPRTLLSLRSARVGGVVNFGQDPTGAPIWPTFQGAIGDDITFFGFAGVSAGAVDEHWVVVEEPPGGFRFLARDDVSGLGDGGSYAAQTLAPPVRVLIRGDIFTAGEGQ
jgi:hypothetical protein